MKMKLMTVVIVTIAIMMSVASAVTTIDGSTITATALSPWHITQPSALVATHREVGEQYMAPRWDVTPFTDFYASGPNHGWVMFDLGADYDLAELRLWNGNVAHGDAGLMGWNARSISIHVAGDGAALPSTDAGLANYFTDPSWTNIWDGDLAQGPGGPALAQDQLVVPQLILDATGNNGVRYVAIDHDSNWGGDAAPTLLGHIQIDEVPKIANISAVRTGLDFVEFEITDVGASELLPGTISVTIDGTNVTGGLTINKVGDVTTVRHEEVPQFVFGATVNYIFSAEDSLGEMILLDDSFMVEAPFAGGQITGITASARNTWHITEVSALVSTNREVGGQYMAPMWDVTPFPEFYGSSESADAWVMFDLGADYDLAEIRLWNANIAHGDAGLMGWYSKNMSIHVAGDGAASPSTDAGLGNYFTDPSWTNIWDGDLAQGPGGTALVQDQLVDPQLILDATGNNGVRYVAIDVDSRYDGANKSTALMGHIQIYGVPTDPIRFSIVANGANLDFDWDSKPGMFYVLRTSSDLAADFATWDSVNVPDSVENNGVFEIATRAPLNLHSIVRPGDPVRFYRVEEYPLPPATVFEDDFDGADQGWTTGFDASDIAMNTVWEMGDPFGGLASGPDAANSAPNCYGTNLTTNYGISSNTWLRSPAIDLTTATGATVTFQQWVDMDEFDNLDRGEVRVLDASGLPGAVIELGVVQTDITGFLNGWAEFSAELPAAALDQSIVLEFGFVSDGDDILDSAGWYLDDVTIITPAP